MIRLLSITIVVLLLLAGIYVGVIAWFDGARIRSHVTERLQQKHGIILQIDEIERELALRPLIRLRGMRVSNAKRPDDTLIEVNSASFRVYPMSFVIGPATLDDIEVAGLHITVPVGKGGALYWDPLVEAMSEWWHRFDWALLHFDVRDLKSEARHVDRGDDALVSVKRIIGEIPQPEDIKILAEGAEANLETTLPLRIKGTAKIKRAALGRRKGEMPVTLDIDGSIEDKKLRVTAVGGNLLAGDPEERDPLRATVKVGEAVTQLSGTMSRDDAMHLDLTLRFDKPGENHEPDLHAEFGISDPGDRWQLTDIKAAHGQSVLSGNLDIEYRDDRRFIGGNLDVSGIRYPEKSAATGGGAENNSELLPKAGLYETLLEFSRKFDANLRLGADNSSLFGIPFQTLIVKSVLDQGAFVTTIEKAEIDDASIDGEFRLLPEDSQTRLTLDATLRNIPVTALIGRIDKLDGVTGRFDGNIALQAVGRSSDAVRSTAAGSVTLYMENGLMPDKLATRIAGDVLAALFSDFDENEKTTIHCALIDMSVSDGLAKPEAMLMDTGEFKMHGRGEISLAKQSVDVELLPYAKDFSMVSMRVPMRIHGPFSKLEFDTNMSAGVETLLTPIEFGSEKDLDCAPPERLSAATGDRQ